MNGVSQSERLSKAPTSRETILTALHARLLALHATALRGEMLPERVSAEGILILRDGEPGERAGRLETTEKANAVAAGFLAQTLAGSPDERDAIVCHGIFPDDLAALHANSTDASMLPRIAFE